jgi:HK97 gp10 family phage protein
MADVIVSNDNREEWSNEFRQRIVAALVAVGEDGTDIASQNAPFDTGWLSEHISYALTDDDKSVIIGTNVEYGPYQELGTSKYKGHPYLVPMLNDNKDRFRAMIESVLMGS